MKELLFSLLLVSYIGVVQSQKVVPPTKALAAFVSLNDSILIAKTEVSVGEYADYLKSIRQDSSESYYRSQLPDSAALAYIEKANHYYKAPYFAGYFKHPAYNHYPVVGISYEQAVNFCKWKTRQFHQEHTQKRYQNVVFRLPSVAEWNQALGNQVFYLSGSRSKKAKSMASIPTYKGIKRGNKVGKTFFNVSDIELVVVQGKLMKMKKPLVIEGPKPQPNSVLCGVKTSLGVAHLVGNVSEMTSIKGQAKGLNFLTNYSDNLVKHTVLYKKPASWLGIRLVVSW